MIKTILLSYTPQIFCGGPKREFRFGCGSTCTHGSIGIGYRYITSDSRKNKKLTGNLSPKTGQVPSAGFIGQTRFDLISQLFKTTLPKEWDLKTLIDLTVKAHDELITHHGVVGGTSKWKSITQYAIGLLEGRAPENPGWVAVGRTNKWPKRLRHLLPVYIFIKDNIPNKDDEKISAQIAEAMRFCLTLFKLNKVCTANSELLPLLENIGKRHRIPPAVVSGFERYVRNRTQEIRESITLSDLNIKFFLSPSNGPNGLPKLQTALEEAAVLKENKKLFDAFERYCTITNSNQFFLFFSQCAKKYQNLQSQLTNIKLRKLTAIPDKGNKARCIAICDIWTQSLLASLEDKIIEITATMFPNKVAYFSHREGWDRIRSQHPDTLKRCVSLDASSWTDNFPASLQFIVVKALFGESLSLCWKALAIDCPWYVPNMPRPIYFGKGQGMGTKASFAIAQLTDLLFVEYVLQKAYGSGDRFFQKVGDDLVAEDEEMHLLSQYEAIGVPINLSKSKFKTSYGTFQEFVSRNLWNQYDCSIISPGLSAKFLRNDYYSITLYYHIAERMSHNPSLTELLCMKRDYLSTKSNFDLEIWQGRHEQLIKIINLLIIGCDLDPDMLKDPDRIDAFKGREALLIARRLVHLTTSLVTYHTTLLNDSTMPTPQSALTLELVGELKEFRNADLQPKFLPGSEEFFKGLVQMNMTFEEAIILQKFSTFVDKISRNKTKGASSLGERPYFEPVLNCQDTGVLILNPEYVRFHIHILGMLMESVSNNTIIGTNPFADRNPGRFDLELFKLVSSIFKSENIVLESTDGTVKFSAPGSRGLVHDLPKDLYLGYMELFQFDRTLSQLDRMGEINT